MTAGTKFARAARIPATHGASFAGASKLLFTGEIWEGSCIEAIMNKGIEGFGGKGLLCVPSNGVICTDEHSEDLRNTDGGLPVLASSWLCFGMGESKCVDLVSAMD